MDANQAAFDRYWSATKNIEESKSVLGEVFTPQDGFLLPTEDKDANEGGFVLAPLWGRTARTVLEGDGLSGPAPGEEKRWEGHFRKVTRATTSKCEFALHNHLGDCIMGLQESWPQNAWRLLGPELG